MTALIVSFKLQDASPIDYNMNGHPWGWMMPNSCSGLKVGTTFITIITETEDLRFTKVCKWYR